MKKMICISVVLLLTMGYFVVAQTAGTDVQTESIRYTVDGQDFVGLLAYDRSSTAIRPGIIVVHEWRGINDYAKKRAADLAEEGYVAFALDMYGDGEEIPMSQARSMSGTVGSDFPLIERRFNAALKVLQEARYVDRSNIAAIGYCFGGGIVLNMARMGTEIDGVVSFHGSLNTGLTADRGDVKTRVLAIQGDADPVAPVERQKAFVEEMKGGEADFSYIIFGNLPAHNFTNPDGSSYYETEANLAWSAMLTFFDEIFE
jgi:dienelactone hydrolase